MMVRLTVVTGSTPVHSEYLNFSCGLVSRRSCHCFTGEYRCALIRHIPVEVNWKRGFKSHLSYLRSWWNGRHTSLRSSWDYSREGSNPFDRIYFWKYWRIHSIGRAVVSKTTVWKDIGVQISYPPVLIVNYGRVSEWFMVLALKASGVKASEGSNPSSSAILLHTLPGLYDSYQWFSCKAGK